MSQLVKTIVLISYNAVNGFQTGWHGDKHLFVHANGDGGWGCDTGSGRNKEERAQSVMGSLSHQFYGKLTVPVKDVDEFFIYAGLHAMRSALAMAKSLKELSNGVKVTVVACDCRWGEKERILRGSGIELLQCGCGGQNKMGDIAQKVLGAVAVT